MNEVSVGEGSEKFVFSSDVVGPTQENQKDFIIEDNPGTVYLDGPLSYMLGYRFSKKNMEKSLENMLIILDKCSNLKDFIVDHHLLRDLHWKERISRVFERAEELGVNLVTAAQFTDEKNNLLEARRKELYQP